MEKKAKERWSSEQRIKRNRGKGIKHERIGWAKRLKQFREMRAAQLKARRQRAANRKTMSEKTAARASGAAAAPAAAT